MKRFEALESVFKNAPNRDNAKHVSLLKILIGVEFYKEFDKMGFFSSEYILGDRYVWLSYLGTEFCKEMFVNRKPIRPV